MRATPQQAPTIHRPYPRRLPMPPDTCLRRRPRPNPTSTIPITLRHRPAVPLPPRHPPRPTHPVAICHLCRPSPVPAVACPSRPCSVAIRPDRRMRCRLVTPGRRCHLRPRLRQTMRRCERRLPRPVPGIRPIEDRRRQTGIRGLDPRVHANLGPTQPAVRPSRLMVRPIRTRTGRRRSRHRSTGAGYISLNRRRHLTHDHL